MNQMQKENENDWLLFARLIPYAKQHQKLLIISMLLLIPLSIVAAIQPLFIGEAISLLRQEKVWNWLQKISVSNGLTILTILLLLTTTIKLVLFSVQGYIVQ
ncbi:MAG TPA: ABC transporter ATP-binding protein, partial [Allocoleopsis sp.]